MADDQVVAVEAEAQATEPKPQQVNKHDARTREHEVASLLRALMERGAPISLQTLDVNNLRPSAEAFAACRILVEKGIATEAEVQHEVYGALIRMLGAVLQIVEQQQLAARRPVAVKKSGLILPRD